MVVGAFGCGGLFSEGGWLDIPMLSSYVEWSWLGLEDRSLGRRVFLGMWGWFVC